MHSRKPIIHPIHTMHPGNHVSAEALQAGLRAIEQSPKASSVLDLIIRRPGPELRESVEEAYLDEMDGLVGDNSKTHGSSRRRTAALTWRCSSRL